MGIELTPDFAGNNHQYIEIQDDDAVQPFIPSRYDGKGGAAIELYYKINNDDIEDGWRPSIFSKHKTHTDTYTWYEGISCHIRKQNDPLNAGKLRVSIGDNNGSYVTKNYDTAIEFYSSSADTADGKWHRLFVWVRRNSNAQVQARMYIDGAYEGQGIYNGAFYTMGAPSNSFYLGTTAQDNEDEWFPGSLARFSVWRWTTASDYNWDKYGYRQGVVKLPDELCKSWFPMDENEGSKIKDKSGAGIESQSFTVGSYLSWGDEVSNVIKGG